MMIKDDPKFQRWVSIVSPDRVTELSVLSATDWGQILAALIDIFQILSALGCFAATRLTTRVSVAMKAYSRDAIASNLAAILSDMKSKQMKGRI